MLETLETFGRTLEESFLMWPKLPCPHPPQREVNLFSDWWIRWCWNYLVTDILVSYILSRHWKETLEYLKLGFGRLVFCSFIVKVFQKWTGPKISVYPLLSQNIFRKDQRVLPSLRPTANTYFPVSSIDFCFLKSGTSGILPWAIIKMTLAMWDQSLTPASGCLCLWQGPGRCSPSGRIGLELSEEFSRLYKVFVNVLGRFYFLQVLGREAKPRQQSSQALKSEVKPQHFLYIPTTNKSQLLLSCVDHVNL